METFKSFSGIVHGEGGETRECLSERVQQPTVPGTCIGNSGKRVTVDLLEHDL